jgi:SAM-dependent methyltransferase
MYEHTAQFYDLFDADAAAALWHADFLARYAKPGARLLDIGAGTGRAAMLLAERGVSVTCVEPSAAMRAIALGRIADDTTLDARLTVLPGDAQSLALGERFDVVAACHLLYFFDALGLDHALTRMRAHLATPGGVLIGDFALLSGRNSHPRTLVAERVIGTVTYRKFTASEPIDDARWRVTWAFEAWRADALIEAASEAFDVYPRDAAACRALLCDQGFTVLGEFGDYAGAAWSDDATASRYVFCARAQNT